MEGRNHVPECSELNHAQLVEVFGASPRRYRAALSGLSESELIATPIPGKWSIKTIAVHVVDTEIMTAARFRQAITGSDRAFAFWNQEVWADRLDYQAVPAAELDALLDLYESLRGTSSMLLERLGADIWDRSGLHAKRGEMTVRQLVEHHTVHSERHVQQILQRREALGRPVALEAMIALV